MEGWIKLHRALLESRFGGNLEMIGLFTSLLLMTNHKEGFTHDGTRVQSGQLMTSQDGLAKRFKMNRGKMRRMLEKLEEAQQIKQQTSTKNTIITITNWHEYQSSEQQTNNKRTTNEQQTNTNKNAKNEKNEKNNNTGYEGDGRLEEKKRGKKTKPENTFHPDLVDAFQDAELKTWLKESGNNAKSQQVLWESYATEDLQAEVMLAYLWQIENSKRGAGTFLTTWLKRSGKKTLQQLEQEFQEQTRRAMGL